MRIHSAVALFALISATSLSAANLDLTKPPETPPIPDVKLPRVERYQLPNGLRVVAAEDPRFPLTTFRIAFHAGSKYDPKDLPGLSDSVAALLNQGTTSLTARQIAEREHNPENLSDKLFELIAVEVKS